MGNDANTVDITAEELATLHCTGAEGARLSAFAAEMTREGYEFGGEWLPAEVILTIASTATVPA